MTDWGGLINFCESERQRQVVELRRDGLSVKEVALKIGIAERNV